MKYYLSPGLAAVVVDHERLSLALYGKRITIKDESGLFHNILTLCLHGIEDVDLRASLPEFIPDDAIDQSIKALLDLKMLVTIDTRGRRGCTTNLLEHYSTLLNPYSLDTARTPLDVQTQAVFIIGQGEIASALEEALVRHHVGVTRHSDTAVEAGQCSGAALVVACSDSEDHAFFRNINQYAIEHGVTSLYVCLDWNVARCGPLAVPNGNACYECYYHRVASTRRYPEEFTALDVRDNILCHSVPNGLALHWATAIATTQILKFLAGVLLNAHLGPILEADTLTAEVTHSTLLKLPRCPVCGRGSAAHSLRSVNGDQIRSSEG